jgi:hypothetical protein
LARWLILALVTSGVVLVQNTKPEPVVAAAAQCIEFSHSSVFYYDTKQAGPNTRNFDAKYLGFKITPTESANVKVEVTGFTDNNKFNVRLASGQPSSQTLGLATSTSPKISYFLTELYANSGGGNENISTYKTNPIETITVTVKDASSNAVLCSRTQSLTVADQTLAANANKIYSARVSTPSTEVGTGSMVVITVTGNTGTVGAGPDGKYDVNFTPVADPAKFAPAAWELKKIEYKGLNANCSKITDQLYFDKSKTPSSIVCSGNYAVSYLFEVRGDYSGSEGSFSEIQSFIYGASGNLIKHTTPSSTVIKLPKANSSSTNKPTVDPTNLDQYINAAISDLPFTVGNLELRTVKATPGNPVNSSTPTYVNATGSPEIQWDKTCLVSGASCFTNSAVTTTGGSWTIVDGPSGAKLLRFTPNSAYETANVDDPADVVVFRLTDGNNVNATASAVAIVEPTGFIAQDVYFKTPPGAASSSATLSATGGTVSWDSTVLIDSASSEVSSVTIPGQGVWTIAGASGQPRALTFTPEANFSGTSFVQFKLTATSGGTSFATGYATTDPRPTVNAQASTVTMGSSGAVTTLSPTVTPSDVSSRCIYATEATSASCGSSLTATSISWTLEANGKVTFVSQFGFTGSATISYKVTDSSGNSATNSMTVTVNPPAAPTITAESGSVSTSKSITLSPTVNSTLTTSVCLIDPADASSCSNEVSVPGKGTWKKNSNGTITFTSVNSFTGSATISARVTDQLGQTGTGQQTVNVTAPTPPTVSSPSGTTAVSTGITASVVVTSELPITTKCLVDPSDSTSCSDTVVIPGKGTFTRVGDQARFNAGANTGSATVSFRAIDSLNRAAEGTVTITITDDPNFNANAVPVVTTSAATNVTETTARMNGNVQSGNVTTNITFCYGTLATLVGCVTVTGTPSQINGGASGAVYANLTGLTGSTTYWYRVIATDSNPYNGSTVSFTTNAAPSSTPSPSPSATQSSDPCEPGVTTSSIQPGLYAKMIGYLVNFFGSATAWTSSFFGGVIQSPIADVLSSTAVPNPLWSQAGYEALIGSNLSIALQAATSKAAPKTVTPQEQLTQEEIVLEPGPNEGEVEVTSTAGDPLSVLAVSPEDPFLSTQFSGADFNKPEVWEFLGYGQLCWKLEPFGDTDLAYVLPNPIKLPPGTEAGDWRYSTVIVKAGSLTARSDTYQTDTIFPAPLPGSLGQERRQSNFTHYFLCDKGGHSHPEFAGNYFTVCYQHTNSEQHSYPERYSDCNPEFHCDTYLNTNTYAVDQYPNSDSNH